MLCMDVWGLHYTHECTGKKYLYSLEFLSLAFIAINKLINNFLTTLTDRFELGVQAAQQALHDKRAEQPEPRSIDLVNACSHGQRCTWVASKCTS